MTTTIDDIQIKIESNSGTAATGIRNLASALGELKKSGSIGTAVKNLNSLSSALKSFTSVTSNASKISSLATALAQLKSVGSFKGIGNSITNVATALKSLQGVDSGSSATKISSLSAAFAPLANVNAKGFTSAVNSLAKISEVTQKIDEKTITEFTSKVERLVNALTPLSQKLTTVKTGLSGFSSAAKKTTKDTQEMSGGIDTFNLNMSTLINVVQQSAQAVIHLATQIKTLIAAAVEWDGIAARFGRGFGAQAEETYDWIVKLNEALGINIQVFMQYSSTYATMLTGFGIAQKDASKMALGYMELTYDIWAGYNDIYKNFSDAADAVRSAIAGEVEPIRRAGFTIVEATLEVTAANHGITKSIESMTEAEKSYLRYLTLVDQAYSQNLVGTYIAELDTAEGLLRTLSQQTKTLSQSFGSLFLPILVRIMPYVQAFVDMLTDLVHIVAGLFGVEIQKVDWSGYEQGATSAGDMADSLGQATKEAKALKNATLGLDELNVISPNTGNNSGGIGAGGEFSGLDVDSLWNESMLKNIQTQVDGIKEKMKEWLGITDDIDTWAEFFETRLGKILIAATSIGVAIAGWKISAGLVAFVKSVKGIYTGVVKIATSVTKIVTTIKAAGIAGLLAKIGSFAKTALPIAGIIMGIGSAIFGMVDSIKNGITWLSALETMLGTTLAGTGIGFLIGGPLGAAIGALIGLVSGALANIGVLIAENWEVITEWFETDFVNFFKDIGEWFEVDFVNAFKAVGKWFKNDFTGFFKDSWKKIKNIDWEQVGYDVGHALGEVVQWFKTDFVDFFKGIGEWFETDFVDFFKDVGEWFETDFVDFFKGIGKWFETDFVDFFKDVGKWFKTDFVDFFKDVADWFETDFANFFKRIPDWQVWDKEFWAKVGTNILDGIVSGWKNFTQAIKDFCNGFIKGFKDALGIHSPSTVARDQIGKNILAGILEALKIDALVKRFKEMWNSVVSWWNNSKAKLKTYTAPLGSIKDKLSSAWNTAKSWWNDKKTALKKYTPSIGSIKDKLSSAWQTAKNWWNKNVKLSIPSLSLKITYTTEGLGKIKQAVVNALDLPGWPKLSFAANGGIFNQGSMIWAGERGAEIVANAHGGKTGVMNVEQMRDAVYSATYAAMMATRQQSGGGEFVVKVYLDGREITHTVEKTQKERGSSIFGTEVYSY